MTAEDSPVDEANHIAAAEEAVSRYEAALSSASRRSVTGRWCTTVR